MYTRVSMVKRVYCTRKTRSSAQGKSSAKSLAGNVVNSSLFIILPCPPCLPPVMLSTGGGVQPWGLGWAGGVWGGGGGLEGRGVGDISIHLPYTAPPHGASP